MRKLFPILLILTFAVSAWATFPGSPIGGGGGTSGGTFYSVDNTLRSTVDNSVLGMRTRIASMSYGTISTSDNTVFFELPLAFQVTAIKGKFASQSTISTVATDNVTVLIYFANADNNASLTLIDNTTLTGATAKTGDTSFSGTSLIPAGSPIFVMFETVNALNRSFSFSIEGYYP